MKITMQWTLHLDGDARNVEWLTRKGADLERSHPKRDAQWAANSKAMERGCLSTLEFIPYHLDQGYGARGLKVGRTLI